MLELNLNLDEIQKNDEISMKRPNDVKLIESDEGKLCEWVNDGRRASIRLK